MADITDPEAIRFVNEEVRPLAETVRDLWHYIDDMETSWFAGLNATITNSAADPIVDGRDAEGISRLTGADVHNLVAAMIDLRNTIKGTARPTQVDRTGIVDKPTVRPLRRS